MKQIAKLPPQAVEVEEAVLGAAMLEREALQQIADYVKPQIFYKETHQIIYRAIHTLFNRSEAVDILTVVNQLKSTGELEAVGGAYFISELTSKISTTANIEYHARIIMQKFIRREAIRIGHELQTIAYDDTIDELESFTAIDFQHKQLSDLLFSNFQACSFAELAQESMKELAERINRYINNIAPGIRTGLFDLDKLIAGWGNGDLIVLAGRPGMGKTAIALHFAKVAAQHRNKIYMFSLEMTNTRLVDRIIVGETNIPNQDYKLGRITDEQYQTLSDWIAANAGLPIYLDERSFVTIDYIVGNARMRKRRGELDMLIIDYLQLIDITVERNGTKDQAIGIITRKLKSLAKELNIPIILLSQLNRKVEERADKRPSLHDLRESGNIEQDADIVMFTYRPAYYKIAEFEGVPTDGVMVLDIAKHRNGLSNVHVVVKHNESLTNFYDETDQKELPY